MSAARRTLYASGVQIWFFHRGALGDSVLLWPRIRMETRAGRGVTLVSDGGKARLAARELGITGLDAEARRFNELWREDGAVEVVEGVSRVVCAGGGGDPAGPWGRSVHRMFPGAELDVIGRPSRELYRGSDAAAGVAVRDNIDGPLVVHIGAGGEEKRWGMEEWAAVIEASRSGTMAAWPSGARIEVIAGEAERERFTARERATFESVEGRFVDDLLELADTIKRARVFVGCDSGPTHLAAALGVRTVALFGPTDPEVWGPIGSAVRIVAPPSRRGLDWLKVERVREEIAAALSQKPREPREST